MIKVQKNLYKQVVLFVIISNVLTLCFQHISDAQVLNFKNKNYTDYQEITYYIRQNPLLSEIIGIEQDIDNSIFILCGEGVVKFNSITFKTLFSNTTINGDKVKFNGIRKFGQSIYLESKKHGIFRIEKDNLIQIIKPFEKNQTLSLLAETQSKQLLFSDNYNKIFSCNMDGNQSGQKKLLDKRGLTYNNGRDLYFLSDSNEVFRYQEPIFEKIHKLSIDRPVSYFMTNADNEFWFILDGDVYQEIRLEKEIISKRLSEQIGDILKDNPISIVEYGDSDIIITSEKGLYMYKTKDKYFYKLNKDFKNKKIVCSYIDYENNIWIGTKNKGLTKLETSLFKSLILPDSLKDNLVLYIKQLKGKVLVQGSNHQYIVDKDYNIIEPVGFKQGSGGYLYVDRNNRMWIIVDNKVYFSDELPQFHEYVLHPSIKNPEKIYLSKNGILWIVTSNGLFIIENNNEPVKVGESSGISSQSKIIKIIDDTKGRIYLFTDDNHIYTKTGNIFKTIPFQSFHTDIMDMVALSEEKLLITTREQLYVYNKKKITPFFDYHKISSYSALQLVLDEQKNLYITSNKNIISIDKVYVENYSRKGIDINEHLRFFDKATGLRYGGIRGRAKSSFDDKNQLWAATHSSISILQTDKIPLFENKPKVNITKIEVNGITKPVNEPLDLNAQSSSIRIFFHATSGNASSFTHLEYKLEGFDKNWIANDSFQDYVDYNIAKEGDYKFKIRGYNKLKSDFSEETYSFKFKEIFSLSKIIYLLVIPLIFALSLGYYYFGLSRNAASKTQLNQEIKKLTYAELQRKQQLIDDFNYYFNIELYISLATIPIYDFIAKKQLQSVNEDENIKQELFVTKTNMEVKKFEYILEKLYDWSRQYVDKNTKYYNDFDICEMLNQLKEISEKLFKLSAQKWDIPPSIKMKGNLFFLSSFVWILICYFNKIKILDALKEIELSRERFMCNLSFYWSTPFTQLIQEIESPKKINDDEIIKTENINFGELQKLADQYEVKLKVVNGNDKHLQLSIQNISSIA